VEPPVAGRPAPGVVDELVATASGRNHRDDPIRGHSGGPAGNARLTAWSGLLLLTLLAVEGATLVSIGSLMGVHIFVGVIVIPPVLLKSGATTWRFLRYYTRHPDYVTAGPPPMVLRVLGPLVIITSVAVLATGLGLIVQGSGSFTSLVTVAGTDVTMATLHKASFIAWFVVMTLHVLGRTLPALRILGWKQSPASRVPGGRWRAAVLAVVLATGLVAGGLVLGASSWWTTGWQHD
jgi:hypothetical protein